MSQFDYLFTPAALEVARMFIAEEEREMHHMRDGDDKGEFTPAEIERIKKLVNEDKVSPYIAREWVKLSRPGPAYGSPNISMSHLRMEGSEADYAPAPATMAWIGAIVGAASMLASLAIIYGIVSFVRWIW